MIRRAWASMSWPFRFNSRHDVIAEANWHRIVGTSSW